MAIKSLKCPNCGGVIESFDEKMNKGFCPFCDSIIIDVQERQNDFLQKYGKIEIEGTVKIEGPVKVEGIAKAENILKNAHSVFQHEKYDEAYRLYTDVLNIDPENHEAIFYRGCTSAMQGSVENNKIEDMMNAYADASNHLFKKVGSTPEFFKFVSESISFILNYCHMFRKNLDTMKRELSAQKGFTNYYNTLYRNGMDSTSLAQENALRYLFILQPNLHDVPFESIEYIITLSNDVFDKSLDEDMAQAIFNVLKTLKSFDGTSKTEVAASKLLKQVYKSKGSSKLLKEDIFAFKTEKLLKEWENNPEKKQKYEHLVNQISTLKTRKEALLSEKQNTQNLPLKRRLSIDFEVTKISGEILYTESYPLHEILGL